MKTDSTKPWRPFCARTELPIMRLQTAWKYETDDGVELFITNYFIGRFPPEYNAELIDRFEREVVEAKKDWLKGRNFEYIDSVVAMYRATDNERNKPDFNDAVQKIVESIQKADMEANNGATGNDNRR